MKDALQGIQELYNKGVIHLGDPNIKTRNAMLCGTKAKLSDLRSTWAVPAFRWNGTAHGPHQSRNPI
ncbi:uncharacterized protein PADG_11367 [Paracoccidioides brasiliensis Pb18]|uniref:Uncharacterized protein n=1 Tax=Paracoccidioides brasiliensis (strain Pb18) TaxID=502780 RepID=A0A0A0HVW4_PARBD|nr:uncharacterized protein PADG_11367 [Paracoccidioides brasiliensis Pb18]KGM92538.1 hypothetical protein PADG_11367 [Paracoccidioides brasiliensis Pb18]